MGMTRGSDNMADSAIGHQDATVGSAGSTACVPDTTAPRVL